MCMFALAAESRVNGFIESRGYTVNKKNRWEYDSDNHLDQNCSFAVIEMAGSHQTETNPSSTFLSTSFAVCLSNSFHSWAPSD